MSTTQKSRRMVRCAYLKACFLAEELKCFGYKNDCPLYQETSGTASDEELFNEAMDRLINKTLAKYDVPPE